MLRSLRRASAFVAIAVVLVRALVDCHKYNGGAAGAGSDGGSAAAAPAPAADTDGASLAFHNDLEGEIDVKMSGK